MMRSHPSRSSKSRLRVGALSFLVACLVHPVMAMAQDTNLVRVPVQPIMMSLPGVAVIRDAEHWKTLWQRFEQFRWREDGAIVRTVPPPIDFHRYMLVAVGLDGMSGCSNQFWWIWHIRTMPDSVIVELGISDEPYLTCAMIIEPLDVVRIPRTTKPIFFRSITPRLVVPDTAPWWNAPDWTAWSVEDDGRRGAFLMAWARDPATSLTDLVEISRRGGGDWTIARVLLNRPEVLESPDVLVGLIRAPDDDGRRARSLLLGKYGARLAYDTAASPAVLRALIDGLREDTAFGVAARSLLANEAVRRDQQLLREIIITTDKYPEVFREACHVYLARWPAWERIPDATGHLTTTWGSSTPCPDLPPPPKQ